MRIAFDHQIFFSQQHGGISRYFARLAQELSSLGETVRVFASGGTNEYLNQLPPTLGENSNLVRILDRQHPRVRARSEPLIDWLIQGQINRWKPQILHETYYRKRKVTNTRIPVVVTVYDMIHELFPGHFDPSNPTSTNKRNAVDRADHIICISENTRRDLIQIFQVPSDKVSVVLLGFDKLENLPLPVQKPVSTTKPYILFVGHRGGYKNFKGLLHGLAASDLLGRDLDLVAFGGGQFTCEENLLMSSLGLPERSVRQVSGNDQDLCTCYREAAAFAYPSLYEGFGLPPLEAMAQGCPVISSNTSSMPEVIGDAAEYFDPSDSESITNALNNVLLDSSRASELVHMGFQRLKMFSWARCARETLEAYRQLAP